MFFGRLLTGIVLSLTVASSALAAPQDASGVSSHQWTNAQRLAKGLPPLPPKRRAPGQLRARTSATPTSVAPSSASDSLSSSPTSAPSSASSSTPTPPPSSASSSSSSSSSSAPSATPTCTVTGSIQMQFFNVITGQPQSGWLSATANAYGLYGYTADVNSALQVCYKPDDTDPTAPVTFIATNGLADYRYLAAIADASDNLTPSQTGNFAAFGGAVAAVTAGSTPQHVSNSYTQSTTGDLETAVWSITPAGSLSATWVNTDGTVLPAYFVWDIYIGGIVLTANLPETTSPSGPGFAATLSFVPASTAP